MNKQGVMIGTHLFETIHEAYAALKKYKLIDESCETFMVELPEKPYNYLLQRTKIIYPI